LGFVPVLGVLGSGSMDPACTCRTRVQIPSGCRPLHSAAEVCASSAETLIGAPAQPHVSPPNLMSTSPIWAPLSTAPSP